MCWHRWSKWEVIQEFEGEYVFYKGHIRGFYQRRHCEKCGKSEIDRQLV